MKCNLLYLCVNVVLVLGKTYYYVWSWWKLKSYVCRTGTYKLDFIILIMCAVDWTNKNFSEAKNNKTHRIMALQSLRLQTYWHSNKVRSSKLLLKAFFREFYDKNVLKECWCNLYAETVETIENYYYNFHANSMHFRLR